MMSRAGRFLLGFAVFVGLLILGQAALLALSARGLDPVAMLARPFLPASTAPASTPAA